MLKKVRIKNFLSCEDTEIEFDNVTALIGRNAAGKTNILKTIQAVASFILGNRLFYKEDLLRAEISLDFLFEENICSYSLSLSENVEIKEVFLCNNEVITERVGEHAIYLKKEFQINELTSIVESILSLFPKNEINLSLKFFADCCKTVRYYILDINLKEELENIPLFEYKKWFSNKRYFVTHSVTMRLLYLWKEDKELFNELQELLGRNGLGLIEKINIGEFQSFYLIRFCVKNGEVGYSELSFGTQRVLIILLALLYDKSTTLLIEQPEDGIHLGLLRKVLSICFTYAEAYNKQLIISTHSPKVINMFPAKSIRFVKMTEQGTKVTQLSEKELAIIPEYLNNEGTLSDFIEAMDDE